jgi:hypothetical protein
MHARLTKRLGLMLVFAALFALRIRANETDHWSLRPLIRPALPSVQNPTFLFWRSWNATG